MEIAIIGFGISGIAACRWALHYGFKPTVYEKNSSLGGVWLTHTYPNCKLQSTRYTYHFNDAKMPEEWGIYPSGNQVFEYLKNYVQTHDLEKHVEYNSNVQSLEKTNGRWELVVNDKKYDFKYVIIATGFYGATANTQFSHSLLPNEINNPDEQFRNKNVVVIGNGPSGCDLACLAAENNAKSVRLLYRSPRWIFSRYLGGISLHFLTCRFFLTIAYYLPKNVLKIVIVVMYLLPIILNSPCKIEIPDEKVNRNNLVLNDVFYSYIQQQLIDYTNDPAESVDEHFVYTKNNKYAHDVVIDARGYETGIPLLGRKTIPKLYRNIVQPEDTSIAFIGFAATFSWVQVSELQCHWFYQQLLGRFHLPTSTAQQMVIDANNEADYHDLAYLYYNYINLLRNDMGLPPITNWFTLPEQTFFTNEI
jgi:dimethylaniline monooxygenase (N-oxide forming)